MASISARACSVDKVCAVARHSWARRRNSSALVRVMAIPIGQLTFQSNGSVGVPRPVRIFGLALLEADGPPRHADTISYPRRHGGVRQELAAKSRLARRWDAKGHRRIPAYIHAAFAGPLGKRRVGPENLFRSETSAPIEGGARATGLPVLSGAGTRPAM